MRAARYEIMEDGEFYGTIPLCPGTWATGATLEACRDELAEVLEDWVLLGVRARQPLPVIEGIELTLSEVA